jgi:hypothetical protein
VHDVLVRKAQEKAAADVEAFKAQQRLAVAATVGTQRAQKDAADAANAAVRGSCVVWRHRAPRRSHSLSPPTRRRTARPT